MARRPRRRAEETREDILTTAETLFRQQGFSGVAIADIAVALDMSPANIFKHFGSKAQLADAIAARHLAQLTDRFAALDDADPPPDRLLKLTQRLMEAHLKDLRENPFIFEMVLMTAQADFPSGQRYRKLMEARLADIIRAGVEHGDYHCRSPETMAATVADGLACVLHPVLLVHTDATILTDRCRAIVALINAALANPLLLSDDR